MMMPMTVMSGGPTGVVTLSGQVIGDGVPSPDPSSAKVRINTDGTVDEFKNAIGAWAQIDSGTDWIIPNGDASSLYEVKLDVTTGDAPNSGDSESTGTWLALSADRIWGLDSIGSNAGDWTISIRYNGGAVIDTGLYEMSAASI